ncbi:Adenosine deaminase/editase [Penicillium macrosclerotiorum]|uniref:Adenosine deaminase/editase n=1 Tax=Penicillium macrosclerotiorum TaxID=303699 RepID=UPI00254925C5|nr:Adenosine deaminase/editase [Penicillium macrosclerotiorum]KAJ5678937.1 Adenosine deaminase/editase [Penicillium macrosclerotiorum]
MELCMAAQEDATPWEVVRQVDSNSTVQEDPEGEYLLDGRAHFSRLGVVRRKPARTDAESTRSKSCSDKLALRQVSSLLSSETSRLVAPNANAYLTGLILPEDEISKVACDRSFGEKGRMEALAGKLWPSRTISDEGGIGYQFRPFQVLSVPEREIKLLWKFAKPKTITPRSTMPSGERPPKKSKPGNVSAIWTAAPSAIHSYDMISDSGVKSLPSLCRSKTGLYETVINGVKQGNRATSPSSRGASALSRAKLWSLLQTIIQTDEFSDHSDNLEKKMPHSGTLQRILTANTYEEFKRAGNDITDPIRFREEAVQDAKKVLKGWISNTGDEGWGLDVLLDSKKRKR